MDEPYLPTTQHGEGFTPQRAVIVRGNNGSRQASNECLLSMPGALRHTAGIPVSREKREEKLGKAVAGTLLDPNPYGPWLVG